MSIAKRYMSFAIDLYSYINAISRYCALGSGTQWCRLLLSYRFLVAADSLSTCRLRPAGRRDGGVGGGWWSATGGRLLLGHVDGGVDLRRQLLDVHLREGAVAPHASASDQAT
jgi:hypothetical protein